MALPLFEVRGPFGARIIAFCSSGFSESNPFDRRDVAVEENRVAQSAGVGVDGDTGYDAVWSCLEWAVIMILDWSLAVEMRQYVLYPFVI